MLGRRAGDTRRLEASQHPESKRRLPPRRAVGGRISALAHRGCVHLPSGPTEDPWIPRCEPGVPQLVVKARSRSELGILSQSQSASFIGSLTKPRSDPCVTPVVSEAHHNPAQPPLSHTGVPPALMLQVQPALFWPTEGSNTSWSASLDPFARSGGGIWQ